jgi:hypothetical protein
MTSDHDSCSAGALGMDAVSAGSEIITGTEPDASRRKREAS